MADDSDGTLPVHPGDRRRDRLVVTALVGVALFMPPMMSIFGHGGMVGGIPLLYLYLFATWALLIGLLALGVGSSDRDRT